jgi:hypothetical protein
VVAIISLLAIGDASPQETTDIDRRYSEPRGISLIHHGDLLGLSG